MTLIRLGALSAVALATACSLDDRSVRVASDAGAQGNAGGLGGAAGTASASRDGGAAGETVEPMVCVGTPVARGLLTDFSDARSGTNPAGGNIQFGTEELGGGSFTYAAPGLAGPLLSLEARGGDLALRIRATPGTPINDGFDWSGFGFGIGSVDGNCIDASGYEGMTFTLEGTLGTCQLLFGVQFSQDNSAHDNPAAGSCADDVDNCYPPHSGMLTPDAAGVVRVPFGTMAGGSPMNEVDEATITGVEWQLTAPLTGPACEANFIVDDVAFFR